MLKHLLVAALAVSSLAMAGPAYHPAMPLPPHPSPAWRAPPPPPPPVIVHQSNDDRLDGFRGQQLLRDFDAARAARDAQALGSIDRQFNRYLADELREARGERGGQMRLNRLLAISTDLSRLQGRLDRRSLSERRSLYGELVQWSRRDGARTGYRF